MLFLAAAMIAGCGGAVSNDGNSETESETAINNNPALGGEILDDTSIIVYVDENLKDVMEELAAEYHNLRPTVTLVINYDNSETAAEQIQDGEACDIFIAAAKQIDELNSKKMLVNDTWYHAAGTDNDAYLFAQIQNSAADELERNAAADFVFFLISDTAREILLLFTGQECAFTAHSVRQ